MTTFKCKGIILKRRNYSEADRILTILTDDLGKIVVLAKGSRKLKSKLAGNLDLFCLDDFILAEGKTWDIVTSAVAEKCYFNVRNNLDATNNAYYFSEIIDKFLPEKEPHKEIFILLDEMLEKLEDKKENLLLSYFELNLLAKTGFKPELENCIKCKEKVKDAKNYFDFEESGIVCGNCVKIGKTITKDAIKLMRLLLTRKMKEIEKIKVEKAVIDEIGKIITQYLKNIHQENLKSERFVRNISEEI